MQMYASSVTSPFFPFIRDIKVICRSVHTSFLDVARSVDASTETGCLLLRRGDEGLWLKNSNMQFWKCRGHKKSFWKEGRACPPCPQWKLCPRPVFVGVSKLILIAAVLCHSSVSMKTVTRFKLHELLQTFQENKYQGWNVNTGEKQPRFFLSGTAYKRTRYLTPHFLSVYQVIKSSFMGWICTIFLCLLRPLWDSLNLPWTLAVCLTEMPYMLVTKETRCGCCQQQLFPSSFSISPFFFSTPSFNCFAAPSKVSLGFFRRSHFTSQSTYQSLNTVNHWTPHFLCRRHAPGFAGDVTCPSCWPHHLVPLHTKTDKHKPVFLLCEEPYWYNSQPSKSLFVNQRLNF